MSLKIQCDVHRYSFEHRWTDHSKLLKSLFARGEDDKGKSGSSLCRLPVPCGGADRDRTGDPLLAKQVLSQLSYSPLFRLPVFRLAALRRLARSVTYPSTLLRSLPVAPCQTKNVLRENSACPFSAWLRCSDTSAQLARRMRQLESPAEAKPGCKVVGLGRFELPTSPLSGVRSNQLSYRPNPIDPRSTDEPASSASA